MNAHPLLRDVLGTAQLVHGREALDEAIARLGKRIDESLNGEPAVFLSVMQGGLIFAGQLALAIKTDL